MQPFRRHVFVCDQQKPEGLPCCGARGGAQILEALRREIHQQGLNAEVQVTSCGSLGLCESGPNMVVYPEGTWYSCVRLEDIPEIVGSHFARGVPVERLMRTDMDALRAEISANRERMLAARRAADAAGTLPPDLNDRIRAFQESRAILTALELDLFSAVGDGASAAETARSVHADPRATEMLLNALASIKLLTKVDGVFRNTPAAARYFTSASPDNARPALLHTAHLWRRWSALADCVRTGSAAEMADAAEPDPDWTEAFIAAMHRNATERAPLVVKTVGADSLGRMLDVGGGSGAYSIAFAQANPKLRCDILDLAAVEPIAMRHIEAAGVGERVKVRAGNLRTERFTQDYDLVLVSAICHMLSPQENIDLLKRCREALVNCGRLVIQDFILDPDKTSPRFGAMFALNMLVGTSGGSSYSESEYTGWLEAAGFTTVEHIRLPGLTGLMVATRA